MNAANTEQAKLMACPACGRQISMHAVSCPQCGHPVLPTVQPRYPGTEARHVVTLLQLAVAILTLGAQGTFHKIVSAENMTEIGDATLLKVFLQTAPLTIAVILITLAIMRKWWAETASTLFFAAVVLFLSVMFGSWFGGLGRLPAMQGNLGTVFFRALGVYWRAYGPGLFVSSLILGVFLAWTLENDWPGAFVHRLKGSHNG